MEHWQERDESDGATRALPADVTKASFAGQSPPRPRLTLNVGITGHRATVLPAGVADLLGPVVDEVFRKLRDATERLHVTEAAIFDSASPQLRLHTPLATGADQVAADGARAPPHGSGPMWFAIPSSQWSGLSPPTPCQSPGALPRFPVLSGGGAFERQAELEPRRSAPELRHRKAEESIEG